MIDVKFGRHTQKNTQKASEKNLLKRVLIKSTSVDNVERDSVNETDEYKSGEHSESEVSTHNNILT